MNRPAAHQKGEIPLRHRRPDSRCSRPGSGARPCIFFALAMAGLAAFAARHGRQCQAHGDRGTRSASSRGGSVPSKSPTVCPILHPGELQCHSGGNIDVNTGQRGIADSRPFWSASGVALEAAPRRLIAGRPMQENTFAGSVPASTGSRRDPRSPAIPVCCLRPGKSDDSIVHEGAQHLPGGVHDTPRQERSVGVGGRIQAAKNSAIVGRFEISSDASAHCPVRHVSVAGPTAAGPLRSG